jgi:hypothetical protein
MAAANKRLKELLLPESYLEKGVIKKGRKVAELPLNTLTLNIDLVIYRGDHTEKKVPSGRHPVFFGDKQSAMIYTRGASEKLSSYIIVNQPNLFHLSYANLLALSECEELTGDELAALEMYLQIGETSEGESFPYIIPVGYLKGKENMEAKLYLNRRILNMVCRLGYDGWIALPGEIIQRNLVSFNKETGEVKYKFNNYNPEVAICHWDQFLTPI